MAAFQRSGLGNAAAAAAPASAPPRETAEQSGSQGQKAAPGILPSAPQGIHPLLLGDAARIQDKFRSLAPKISSLQANKRQLPGRPAPATSSLLDAKPVLMPVKNPYLTSEADRAEGPKPKSMHRALQFHRPGKYVMEAEQVRRDEKMKELKERIEATARKAGLQDELLPDERILRVRCFTDSSALSRPQRSGGTWPYSHRRATMMCQTHLCQKTPVRRRTPLLTTIPRRWTT